MDCHQYQPRTRDGEIQDRCQICGVSGPILEGLPILLGRLLAWDAPLAPIILPERAGIAASQDAGRELDREFERLCRRDG